MCPPRRSPAASARSRFTPAPAARPPRAERASVSNETSKNSAWPRAAGGTSVRQTPETAMLSPTVASPKAGGRSTARTAPAASDRSETTRATADTRPVNISRSYPTTKAGRIRADSRRSAPIRTASRPARRQASPRRSAPSPASGERASAPPTRSGATYAVTRSTRPAFRNDAAVTPPPSTSTERTSRAWSAPRRAPRSTPPPAAGLEKTCTPRSRNGARRGSRAGTAVTSQTSPPAAENTRAVAGTRRAPSRTSRRCGVMAEERARRRVRSGSSARTVPAPTRMASHSSRRRRASFRAASPVIHFDSPVRVAMRPSSDAAHLTWTKGRRSRMDFRNASFSVSASSASAPTSTSTPRSLRRRMPRPAVRGSGSSVEHTTRDTPAAMSASEQGGVRPKWEHGSRLTSSVAPLARAPATARATASACGPPARSCAPSPTTVPAASTSTAPTRGFGAVEKRPRPASSKTRRQRTSSGAASVIHERPGEGCRVEVQKVVRGLPHSHVTNRQRELAHDGEDHAALGGPVHFREDEAGDTRGLLELARLRDAVHPRHRVQDEEDLVRRARDAPGRDPADLRELLHEIVLRVEPSRGVHEQQVGFPGESDGTRVVNDGGGIGACLVLHQRDVQARGPDLELLDRRGAKRVGRGEDDRLPGGGRSGRELGGRCRFSRAVDPHDENHVGKAGRRARQLGPPHGQSPGDLRLQDAPNDILFGRIAASGLRFHGGHELRGRRRPNVRRDQALLQRVERRGIRLEGGFHRAPHLREELRVGHEKAALQAGEDGRTVALAFGHQLPRLAGHEAQEISAASRTRASSRRGRATCVWPAASKTTRTK